MIKMFIESPMACLRLKNLLKISFVSTFRRLYARVSPPHKIFFLSWLSRQVKIWTKELEVELETLLRGNQSGIPGKFLNNSASSLRRI